MATLTIPATTRPTVTRPTTTRAGAPARSGAARSSVRLTRRGRRLARSVVVAALVVLAFVGFVLGQGGVSVAGTGSEGPATVQVVVQPGQSLWSIAAQALPGMDAREAVVRVAELNGIAPGARLTPGQALVLPATA